MSFATHAELTEPEKTVFNFYQGYLVDSPDIDFLINTYVSQVLMKSIDESLMCTYGGSEEDEKICSTQCKDGKCQYHGIWVETDVNYYTKSQDTYPAWQQHIKTQLISQNDATAMVNVTLGKVMEEKVDYTVTLIKNDNSWKIWQVVQ